MIKTSEHFHTFPEPLLNSYFFLPYLVVYKL